MELFNGFGKLPSLQMYLSGSAMHECNVHARCSVISQLVIYRTKNISNNDLDLYKQQCKLVVDELAVVFLS